MSDQQHDTPGPIFFLSYARTSERAAPDRWVTEFYNELRDSVAAREGQRGRRQSVGFMDRSILKEEDGWTAETRHALETCRVFVPLLSLRYFHSERCGKEWAAFTGRTHLTTRQHEDPLASIVPALWAPVPLSDLPTEVHKIKLDMAAFGIEYTKRGLYGLMRSAFDEDRVKAVTMLTDQISIAARNSIPGLRRISDYAATPDAFAGSSYRKDVRLVVVPPHRVGPEEWSPYALESDIPLPKYATDIVRRLGYEPVLIALHEAAGTVFRETTPAAPCVVILALSSLADPQIRHHIRDLDEGEKAWISVIVVADTEDPAGDRRGGDLHELLKATLRNSIGKATPISRIALNGVSSMAAFRRTLSDMTDFVGNQYLRYATTLSSAEENTDHLR
ncbi:TIR-like protein FxsC [Nonomuraea fuscirosea]|uniref:TIR-like protein FxsC n=1 Tax=Nonomuraea fuscirosea TaxID=1291556 RepID=UPI0033EDAD87